MLSRGGRPLPPPSAFRLTLSHSRKSPPGAKGLTTLTQHRPRPSANCLLYSPSHGQLCLRKEASPWVREGQPPTNIAVLCGPFRNKPSRKDGKQKHRERPPEPPRRQSPLAPQASTRQSRLMTQLPSIILTRIRPQAVTLEMRELVTPTQLSTGRSLFPAAPPH